MRLRGNIALFGLLLTILSLSLSANPEYQLPGTITPSFQKIHLKLDPDSPDFSGETWITIQIAKPTNVLAFYQIDLDLQKVELLKGEEAIPLSVTAGNYDIQTARADKTLAVGEYRLHIIYSGKVNTSSDGLYLSRFEDRNYLFTQFEDMEARRAFPSFDQPNYKIPYQVTIEAPQKQVVLSNTPVAERTVENGWQKVVFKQTKPMPTYLVAFAVGELDSAEITGLSVPGKIYTPKGKAAQTKFIVSQTPQILNALENYFGMPYPYEKLDFIAVPNFTHGAMENAGLITYRSSLLLLEDEPGLAERSGPLNTVTHEIAHQWYGNLVTMAWWDDLWLNEAFASWMASKIMMQLYPELNFQNRLEQEGAFIADASPTTKPVKKVVRSSADVMDGLGLNYSKGESILNMIESLIGEKPVQQAIQKYMQKHKWGNTTADDLWAVFADVADFDVPAMMKTYLEQPGYPLVEFSDEGKIVQKRYRLAGADVEEQIWTVPLAISYKKNGKIHHQKLYLNAKESFASQLAEADWIYPNDNAMGYFRWKTSAKQRQALLADVLALSSREKKELLYNSGALLQANEISLDQHMQVLNSLAQVDDPDVVRAVIGSLRDLTYLVDDSNTAVFAHFVQAKMLPWYEKLGVRGQDDDAENVIRLRQSVFSILSEYGHTQAIDKQSRQLTEQYLADPASVSKGIATSALSNVAKYGDASWFEKYRQAYLKHTDANIRYTIMAGMDFPQDSNLSKLMAFSFDEQMSPADVIYNLRVASQAQEKQDLFYQWLDKNFDKLVARMPSYHVARMPEFVSSSCDTHNMELAKAFYPKVMDKFDGMTRSFEVAMDGTAQCIALKERFQPDFTRYLQQVDTQH
ncbi:M1 family metallopeptidase [Aliiglaciecola sp. CAU 1673]|uniref:M1 family metallopeptidase n=1 Tax=Aliiglaciecola sp. CAU 1673 TaxID=3032595 RepID=UPI0023DA22BA|nr:M1 family metallopeptidase [Aliiglaciecola sp. CAU 1673]MDF2177767.1 M1 family metallopeptidase [Aliiglaciecola sp. CAU 1673]